MHSFERSSFFQNMITGLLHYGVIYLLIPGNFIIQIAIVYPKLAGIVNANVKRQLVHLGLISFCFANVVGNMIFSIMMDSIMKLPVFDEGTFCEVCQKPGPTKSWHCHKCKACIINKDHHCNVFSCCIGLYNRRYFVLFLGHTMLWLIIASSYILYLIKLKFAGGWIRPAVRIFNPFLRLVIPEPFGMVDVYLSYLFLNLAGAFWSGSLFFFHFRNVVMGVTSYEAKIPSLMDSSKWRQNVLNVFGTRWYYALVCPLFDSPLPISDDKIP